MLRASLLYREILLLPKLSQESKTQKGFSNYQLDDEARVFYEQIVNEVKSSAAMNIDTDLGQ